MANEAAEDIELPEKNFLYIERLLYDVLVVTLPICGLPKTSLPTPNCEENTYESTNFFESACAAVLTRSLCIRNEWANQLWISILSKENDCGFEYDYIPSFLNRTFACFQKKNARVTKNFLVEMSFGFCNEIMLFVHHQRIDFDFNKLLKSVSKFIASAVSSDLDVVEIIDELFFEYDSASLYMKWITDFSTKFAVPYGFRDDIPDLFKKCFDKLWKSEFEEPTYPDTPLKIKLRNPERFSLYDSLSDIATEEYTQFLESLEPKLILPDDTKSSELSESSENESLNDGKLHKRLSNKTNKSVQSSENGRHSSDILGMEEDLKGMSLSENETSKDCLAM